MDGGGVHGGDVADETDVGVLAVDDDRAAGGGEQVGVLAGDPDGVRAVGVDQADEFAADLAEQHHADDVHHLGGGDAETTAELPCHAQSLQHGVDLRSAAVDDDGMDADGAQECHVGGEGALEPVVDHGVAAVLDHDGLVPEFLQPRQRLGEDVRLLVGGELRDGIGGRLGSGHDE